MRNSCMENELPAAQPRHIDLWGRALVSRWAKVPRHLVASRAKHLTELPPHGAACLQCCLQAGDSSSTKGLSSVPQPCHCPWKRMGEENLCHGHLCLLLLLLQELLEKLHLVVGREGCSQVGQLGR